MSKKTIYVLPYGEIELEDDESKSAMGLELYMRAVLANPVPAAALVLDVLVKRDEMTILDPVYASALTTVTRVAMGVENFGETPPDVFTRPELVEVAMQDYLERILASIRRGPSLVAELQEIKKADKKRFFKMLWAYDDEQTAKHES